MMNNSIDWEVVQNDELSILQRKVLFSENRTERQRELLEYTSAQKSDDFCEFFLKLGINGTVRYTSLPDMTESEFLDPPWISECELWERLECVPPSITSTPGCWTRICLQAIEEGKITPACFAREANSSKDQNGRSRITRALRDGNTTEIERCVRRIFRVMGGVFSRGRRTSFIDCPLAKAWWRHLISLRTSKMLNESRPIQVYSNILRKRLVWELLIERIISNQTVIGFPKVCTAVMHELEGLERESLSLTKKSVAQILLQAGNRCTNYALELLDINEVINLISDPKPWISNDFGQ